MEQTPTLSSPDAPPDKLPWAAGAAAVLAGALASACCLGPVLFAALGLGGAGLLARFDPYRPLFTLATFAFLGVGFWRAYRTPKARAGAGVADCGCERPRTRTLGRAFLWIAATVAVGSWAFPWFAERFGG